jgi:hypothetical protein
VNAQWLVRLSAPGLRTAPRIPRAVATSLEAMKERFPSDRRPAWRQRFLAIARELEAAPRRDPADATQAGRRPLLAARSLRGIRLGCIRA